MRTSDPAALQAYGIDCLSKRDGRGMIAAGWTICQLANLHEYQASDLLTDGYRVWRRAQSFDRVQGAAFLADLFGALNSLTPPAVPAPLASAPPEEVVPAKVYFGTRCWAGNELLEATPDAAVRQQYEPQVFAAVADAPKEFVPTRTVAFATSYATEHELPQPWASPRTRRPSSGRPKPAAKPAAKPAVKLSDEPAAKPAVKPAEKSVPPAKSSSPATTNGSRPRPRPAPRSGGAGAAAAPAGAAGAANGVARGYSTTDETISLPVVRPSATPAPVPPAAPVAAAAGKARPTATPAATPAKPRPRPTPLGTRPTPRPTPRPAHAYLVPLAPPPPQAEDLPLPTNSVPEPAASLPMLEKSSEQGPSTALSALRERIYGWLYEAYPETRLESNDWITVPGVGPSTVQVETSMVLGNRLKVEVFTPLVLDVPVSADLLRFVAVEGSAFHFGGITVDVDERDDTGGELGLLQFSYSMLADHLGRDDLLTSVALVASTAIERAQQLRRRFGGALYSEFVS